MVTTVALFERGVRHHTTSRPPPGSREQTDERKKKREQDRLDAIDREIFDLEQDALKDSKEEWDKAMESKKIQSASTFLNTCPCLEGLKDEYCGAPNPGLPRYWTGTAAEKYVLAITYICGDFQKSREGIQDKRDRGIMLSCLEFDKNNRTEFLAMKEYVEKQEGRPEKQWELWRNAALAVAGEL